MSNNFNFQDGNKQRQSNSNHPDAMSFGTKPKPSTHERNRTTAAFKNESQSNPSLRSSQASAVSGSAKSSKSHGNESRKSRDSETENGTHKSVARMGPLRPVAEESFDESIKDSILASN
jgi:hypothetical protein